MRSQVTSLLVALTVILASTWVGASAAQEECAESVWAPIDGMTICMPSQPTEAEFLALRRLNREIERFTGSALPVFFGRVPPTGRTLYLGTRATLAERFASNGWIPADAEDDADAADQSYVLAASDSGDGPVGTALIAAGCGQGRSARSSLGLGYAVGELIRRLDVEGGQWGFRIPATPLVKRPATKVRTIYHMVSLYASDGVSLLHYSPEEMEEYVDRLVDARYSRVTFWQYCDFVLFPGNRESVGPDGRPGWRGRAQEAARQMRQYLDYARSRGLEVYQMLTPAHVSRELLPADPKFVRKGFEGYGEDGVCWGQAESRELAREFCRAQMEYYGPVDGYYVWFFDPAGCFCDLCRDRQDERMFDQLATVDDLSKTISPGARLVACLWPTWCFAAQKLADYTESEVAQFVSSFLAQCRERYGAGGLTIMDTCEYDHTNIYNGLADPSVFGRAAFLYGATGFHGEAANALAPFKLRYVAAQMGLAKGRGTDEGMIYVYFEETNFPTVFTFSDTLYEGKDVWGESLRRYAQTLAKGEATAQCVDLLTQLDLFDYADRFPPADPASATSVTDAMLRGVEETTRAERAACMDRAEAAWEALKASPNWFGNSEWLDGYVQAQRWLLRLGEAPDEAAYAALWSQFADAVGSIPMYADYMHNLINAPFARAHWPKR